MSDGRITELLLAAAGYLEDGKDPFDISFLREHDVTLDEVYTLSEQLAMAAKVWVRLTTDRKWMPVLGFLIVETITHDD